MTCICYLMTTGQILKSCKAKVASIRKKCISQAAPFPLQWIAFSGRWILFTFERFFIKKKKTKQKKKHRKALQKQSGVSHTTIAKGQTF